MASDAQPKAPPNCPLFTPQMTFLRLTLPPPCQHKMILLIRVSGPVDFLGGEGPGILRAFLKQVVKWIVDVKRDHKTRRWAEQSGADFINQGDEIQMSGDPALDGKHRVLFAGREAATTEPTEASGPGPAPVSTQFQSQPPTHIQAGMEETPPKLNLRGEVAWRSRVLLGTLLPVPSLLLSPEPPSCLFRAGGSAAGGDSGQRKEEVL